MTLSDVHQIGMRGGAKPGKSLKSFVKRGPQFEKQHSFFNLKSVTLVRGLLLRPKAIKEGFKQKKQKQKKRQRSSRLFEGQILFNSLPRQLFCLGRFGRIGCIQPFLSNQPRQNSQRGKELNKFCLPNRRDDLCLCFCIIPSSMLLKIHKNKKFLPGKSCQT